MRRSCGRCSRTRESCRPSSILAADTACLALAACDGTADCAGVMVGDGAAAGVDGPADEMNAMRIAEALTVVPRVDFKRWSAALGADHCRRKSALQMRWPDPLCRKVAPDAPRRSVEQASLRYPPRNDLTALPLSHRTVREIRRTGNRCAGQAIAPTRLRRG